MFVYDLNGTLIEEFDREYGSERTESVSAVTSLKSLVRKPGSWSNSIFRQTFSTGIRSRNI